EVHHQVVWINGHYHEYDGKPGCIKDFAGFPGAAGITRQQFIHCCYRGVNGRVNENMAEEVNQVLHQQGIGLEFWIVEIDQTHYQYHCTCCDSQEIDDQHHGASHNGRWMCIVDRYFAEQLRQSEGGSQATVAGKNGTADIQIQNQETSTDYQQPQLEDS